MIPVLEVAIELKKKEIAEEAPFRMLLVGQFIKRYKIPHEVAESKVDELIKWWKFKNRTHRALLSDDVKALNMIVSEFGNRIKQESVRNRSSIYNDNIINHIINNNDRTVIMVAHKSDNKYVAYVACNDHNIWACEQTWTHNRVTNEISLHDSKEWKTVDKRYMKWDIIYKTDRWNNWKINPMLSSILTDAELQQAVEFAINKYQEAVAEFDSECEWGWGRRNYPKGMRFMPLCIYYDEKFNIKFWCSSSNFVLPNELILTNKVQEPHLNDVEISWERKKDGIVFKYGYEHDRYCYNNVLPWEKDYHGRKVNVNILKKWDENIAVIENEFKEYEQFMEKVRSLDDKYEYVIHLLGDLAYDDKVKEARVEFDNDFGDPELWEDHLNSLKITKSYPYELRRTFNLLAERHIEVVGMTLRAALELAATYDEEANVEKYKKYFDFVIPLPTKSDN